MIARLAAGTEDGKRVFENPIHPQAGAKRRSSCVAARNPRVNCAMAASLVVSPKVFGAAASASRAGVALLVERRHRGKSVTERDCPENIPGVAIKYPES